MLRILFVLSLLLMPLIASADFLQPSELKNQFDEIVKIDESVQWIVFSTERKLSDQVNKTLEALKISDPKEMGGMYVADISAMPGMISRMFALPKMRKYSFKVVLDQEGDVTKAWPKKEGHLALIELKSLEITKTQFVSSEDEIVQFLKSKQK